MRKIASAIKDTKMRTAATGFERAQRASSRTLAAELATYAKVIAAAG
jgi:hypothetical protein